MKDFCAVYTAILATFIFTLVVLLAANAKADPIIPVDLGEIIEEPAINHPAPPPPPTPPPAPEPPVTAAPPGPACRLMDWLGRPCR